MGSQASLALTFYVIGPLFPGPHLHLMLFSLLTAFAFLTLLFSFVFQNIVEWTGQIILQQSIEAT